MTKSQNIHEKRPLTVTHPSIAAQWHPQLNGELGPAEVTSGSTKKVWWQDALGHEWQTTPSHRTKRNQGCPYCGGFLAIPGETDLATTHPKLAAELHPTLNEGLTASTLKAGSSRKIWWLGACGHEWAAVLTSRATGNLGCPICSGQQTLAGFNDLATTHPKIAAQWHPTLNGSLQPTMVSRGSNKSIWWLCEHGHEWQVTPNGRVRRDRGCPYCAGQRVIPGVNDLATMHPEIAKMWHPTLNGSLTPSQVMTHSGQPRWWLCDRGHANQLNPDNIARRGFYCSYCTNRKVLAGYNDLATLSPEIASQWHPSKNGDLKSTDVTIGSDVKAWWLCEHGHAWQTWVYARKANGCPACFGLATTSKGEAELAQFMMELLPGAVVRNKRGLLSSTNAEVDIYVSALKIGVEYNGVYWHSEAHGKQQNAHHRKQQLCTEAGIQLIQIWEDDWRDNRACVMRMLAHKTHSLPAVRALLPAEPAYFFERVGARTCSVTTEAYAEAVDFLRVHHIQKEASGGLYLGLRDQQQRLRAIMVLKQARNGELILERYASAGAVAGGFTKLLAHVRQQHPGQKIITFAALDVSQGDLYERSGFIATEVLKPDYSYVVGPRRVHKFNYRKARFEQDPKLKYDPALSETQLANLNGLNRIWDAGKIRYELPAAP